MRPRRRRIPSCRVRKAEVDGALPAQLAGFANAVVDTKGGRPIVVIEGIRAFHPADRAGGNLLCPVYDTLTDSDFRRYAQNSWNAANFVPRQAGVSLEDFLASAPRRLRAALDAGAYVQDAQPSLYVYGIRYSPPKDLIETLGAERRRPEYLLLGLVGALDLVRSPSSSVAPHELTFADRVEERRRLTGATGMHFAPILAGYTLPDHAVNDSIERALGLNRRDLRLEGSVAPVVRGVLDGTEHILWKLDDQAVQAKLLEMVAGLRLMILDGHHRYEAARMGLGRGGPGIRPTVMLVESRDRALHLLPWHRVAPPGAVSLSDLTRHAGRRFQSVEPVGHSLSVPELVAELGRMSARRQRGFLAADASMTWRFLGESNDDGGYDFDLLHGYLEDVFHLAPSALTFERSPRGAIEAIRTVSSPRAGGVAFLLPALDHERIEERAFTTKRVMARKSTMFIPKVAEGVLFAPAAARSGD